jgi:uncharacterized protein involved in exopolysaccharide biosynthesis
MSLVFRRKGIVLAIFSLIFLASVIGLARQHVVYVAETKILVMRGSGGVFSPLNSPRLQWWEEMRTEVELLRSRPVVERASAELERKWQGVGITDRGTEMVTPAQPSPEDILDGMTAEPIEEANIIRITYHALDGRTAIDGVNAIASAYLDHRREMKSNKQTAEFFQEQIEQARSKVERMRAELAIYKADHGITDITQESDEMIHQRALLETDLSDARGKRAELESELRVIESAAEDPSGVLVPTVELSTFENMKDHQRHLADLEAKLNNLRSTYTEESPPVQAVLRDLQATKETIRDVVADLTTAKRNQLGVLRTREASIQKELASIETELEKIPEQEARVAMMSLELKTATDRLEELEAQHQQHFLSEEVDPRLSNLQQVSPAITAKRVGGGAKQKLFMVFSFLLASGMALVAAFMVDTLDHTIKFPADVESALGIPVLASVREVKPVRPRADG